MLAHTMINLIRFTFVALLFSSILQAQTILLPEQWRFTTQDDSSFADPRYDDSGWGTINVPLWWEREGYDGYDGTVWYRTHFDAQVSWKEPHVYLVLGKIDDADETYLNGARVGSMGKFPPQPVTAWNEVRVYKIPASLLTATNVLAVRVNDTGGPGGIVSGPLGIYNERDYQREFNPPPGAKKSFHQLVTSNGLIAAVYDERRGTIESVRPHIFQAYDSARFVQPFVGKAQIRITDYPRARKTGYEKNTHIIVATYSDLKVRYFAPFTTEEKVFYAVVSGRREKVEQCSFEYKPLKTEVLVDSVFFERPKGRAEKYYLISFVDSLHTDKEIVAKAKSRLIANGGNLVREEVKFMQTVFARARMPMGIRPAERAALEQSITVLKMAQVSPREVFPLAAGQVLASLPPGGWNITWVRDGMYAILGMTRLGLYDEARRALEFYLNAKSSHYVRHVFRDGKDYGVGKPYRISVTRYFGIGKEESDYSENGPNIELDGFGLFLIALCDYVERSGDTALFETWYSVLAAEVADAIIHCIDKNDLIRIDSGPWERHLPGKQFAYTSIACAAGLRDFAALSKRLHIGEPAKYQQAYEQLMTGMRTHLLINGTMLKGNVEAADTAAYDFFDGGTFEAFAFGLFDAKLFRSHLREYERQLRVPGGDRGFSRINKGDWYEISEWILLDMRVASAMQRFGNKSGARKLVDWVTKQTGLNFNLIPELYHPTKSSYDGAVPMVGFGAGAYAVAVSDLYSRK